MALEKCPSLFPFSSSLGSGFFSLLLSSETLNIFSLLLLEQWIYCVVDLLLLVSRVRVFTPGRSCSWQGAQRFARINYSPP